MTTPQSPPPGERAGGPDNLDRFFGWLRGLGVARRTDDKWVAGVASGLADRLRVDPVVVRAGLVLLTLLFGVGLTFYLIAWSFLPTREGRISAEEAIRRGDGGSIFLLIITTLSVLGGFPWWSDGGWGGFPWGLLVVGGLVWFVIHQQRKGLSTQQRQEWDQRASRWGEDIGNRVGEWGDQIGQKASDWGNRVGGEPGHTQAPGSTAGTHASGTTPQDTPCGYGPAPTSGQPTTYQQGTYPQGAYQPGAGGPGGQAMVATAPAPAPVRRSGGLLMALVALGLALLTYGATYWAAQALDWPGQPVTIALAATLGALGLLVLGLGVAGWKSGFAGFLAIVTAVLAATSLALPGLGRLGGQWGEQTWSPTSLTTQTTTFELGGGEGVVDLTAVPPAGLDGKRVEVSVGLGKMTVIVPDGVRVDLSTEIGAGEVQVPDDDATGHDSFGGVGVEHSQTVGSGSAVLQVHGEVGLGQIILKQE